MITIKGGEVEVYEFGPFRLDARARRLWHGKLAVPVTVKLFDILLLLVRRAGQVVSKEEFMQEVWDGQIVEENNLTVSVSLLRRALGERPRGREYIETVPKRGYRFIAPVRMLKVDEYVHGGQGISHKRGAADLHDDAPRLLAVLPFLNLAEDETLEYVVDGMTESLINSLSGLAGLKVLARGTVFRYKGKDNDPTEVGAELGVHAVLTGTARREKELIILSVELVDVSDGSLLWGERFRLLHSDILEVQERVFRAAVERLRLRLANDEGQYVTKRYTGNTEAYHLYLKGLYFWNRRTGESMRKGLKYFEEAIRLDGTYALAYAGMAACYNGLIVNNVHPPKEMYPLARAAALKAVELDDTLAEAHASLGNTELIALHLPRAQEELSKAIELNPSYAPAHFWYSIYLTALERFDEAIAEARKSQSLDPLSPPMAKQLANIYYFARQYDQTMELCHQAIELDPNYYQACGLLGLAYTEKGLYDEAIRELKKTAEMTEDPEAEGLLAYAYAVSGDRNGAVRLLNKLLKLSARMYVPPFLMVFIYAGLGQKEKAFEWLERTYEHNSYALLYMRVLPATDCLRQDPRYPDLLRRLNLTS